MIGASQRQSVIITAGWKSTESPSFGMAAFSSSLKRFSPGDCRCYVSRRISTALTAKSHTHELVHCPMLWHQPNFANVTCAWSWRPCGINTALQSNLVASHYVLKPSWTPRWDKSWKCQLLLTAKQYTHRIPVQSIYGLLQWSRHYWQKSV